MSWKDLPRWKKGGIITSIIYLLLILGLIIYNHNCMAFTDGNECSINLQWFFMLGFLLMRGYIILLGAIGEIIVNLAIWFIIGAIFGWFIGEIKTIKMIGNLYGWKISILGVIFLILSYSIEKICFKDICRILPPIFFILSIILLITSIYFFIKTTKETSNQESSQNL